MTTVSAPANANNSDAGDTPDAASAVGQLAGWGMHLIRLPRGAKKPPAEAWNSLGTPSMTVEEAATHVTAGGNVGFIPGRSASRWLVIDAEDTAATETVRSWGFQPTVVTAKSHAGPTLASGETNNKQGGTHTYVRLPGHAPKNLEDLHTTLLTNGGKVEIFVSGDRYIVAPPSRLDEAHGNSYAFTGVDASANSAVPLAWLWDLTVPYPAGGEVVRGRLAPKSPREKVEQDARSIELDNQVDSVPWDQWIAGDPRLTATGQIDTCGCPIYYWQGADHDKSATLHDGCEQGNGVHIWSGTMLAELGLHHDHTSRLNLAKVLHGGTIRERAAAVGIELAPERDPLGGLGPADFEAMAAELEAAGDPTAGTNLRATAENLRSLKAAAGVAYVLPGTVVGAPDVASRLADSVDEPPLASVIPLGPRIGTVGGAATLRAAVAPAVGDATQSNLKLNPVEESAAASGAPTDDEQSEAAAQASAQSAAETHMAAADAPELLDAIFCTPLLKQIRRRANAAQVSPMLALSANINGVLSVVPHDVALPKLTGKRRQPLNLITVPVDESGGGKGGATTVDIDPVPFRSTGLPASVSGRLKIPSPINVGSGEAIAGCFSRMEKDNETGELRSVNHSASVWLAWDEVAKIVAVRDRKGSTIEPELCHGWSWERLGSATKTNPYWTETMSYRMLVTICAQLVTAAGLLADEYTGLVQRIWWVSAAYRIGEEDAQPEKLAAGRRDATGEWFAEPDDDEPLIPVELPQWPDGRVLRVAASVAAEVELARAAHGRRQKSHPWDRHQLLIRLRLAAAGAILHGCADLTCQWWQWAGLLIQHSQHVRAAVVALRGAAKRKQAAEDGRGDAVRAEARQSAQWRRAVDATEAWAAQLVVKQPEKLGRFTVTQAKRAAGPGFRKDNMGDILAALSPDKLVSEVIDVPSAAGGKVLYFRYVGPSLAGGEKWG